MSSVVSGYCNSDETAARAAISGNAHNLVTTHGLTLSSLGCGTHLGDQNDETQRRIQEAIGELIDSGLNVIDTAPNYRNGDSERAVGAVLREACAKGVSRSAVFLSTKVGILPDRTSYCPQGIIDGRFCYAPSHILASVEESRIRLGVNTIDCLYLHNFDEAQVHLSAQQREDVIGTAIQTVKVLLERNWIRSVGLATWDGLRVGIDHPSHLDLVDWVRRFWDHGIVDRFGLIQLPLGIWAPEALMSPVQRNPQTGHPATTLEVACALGLTVIANSSLLQGKMLSLKLPEFSAIQGFSPAQYLIQWTRSQPEVAVTLVGMKSAQSVEEGKRIMALPKSAQVLLSDSNSY